MPNLKHKIATFKRVARERGVLGILAAVENNARYLPGYPRLKHYVRTASVAPQALGVRRRDGSPRILLGYFGGIGDDLLLTTVLRELRARDYRGVWMLSEWPELFRLNEDVDVVVPWDRRYEMWIDAFGWDFVRPWYSRYIPDGDRDLPPPRHILAMMCEKVGIVGPVALKPYLALTGEEREGGQRMPNQIVIQSAGLDARFSMKTKQWFPERYQQVVTTLKHEFNFIQVGSKADPPLEGVLDLRGKTSLRETAALMSRSVAFVGQVGMLMHLARAVDCRGVIVYGGRELPSQSGYSGNENLYGPVSCSPCWQLNTCGHGMACMREIGAVDVVRAIERQAARHGQPLPVDVDVITTDGVPMRTTGDGRTMLTVTDVFGDKREIEAKFPRGSDAEFAPAPLQTAAA